MDNNALNALLGVLMPFVVDIVGKWVKSPRNRFLVALGLCFVAAGIVSYADGKVQGVDFFADFGVIFGLSQVIYKTYWEKSVAREGYLYVLGDKVRAKLIKAARQ